MIVDLSKLDASQRQVATCEAPNIVVQAPAGSGKTSTLIAAIAYYRKNHPKDRICAITYTRAARAEMEQRLKEIGVNDVEVTTIHVWSRNLLKDFSIKYDFKIQILEEAQIKDILSDLVKEYTRHSRVKSVNISILYTYITGNKHMDITDNYKRTLNALEERYLYYKQVNRLYDFTDYPQYLYDVLETYDEEINTIDALFVDEFQDVDTIQFELFEKVNSNKKFFIGDPKQSIFIFRNADGEVFQKVGNFEQFCLKYNYRSYQEIIDYATSVYKTLTRYLKADSVCYITRTEFIEPSGINCAKGKGGTVTTINPWGECYQFTGNNAVKISSDEAIKQMLDRNPMILCRTNKQVKAVSDNSLYTAETVHQAKGLEYDNVIVIDTDIKNDEDLNVAYVALTRARNNVLVVSWAQFEQYVLGGKY